MAPAGGHLEAGDHPQHRGLAAAARPEQREELALLDVEVDAVDGDDLAGRPTRSACASPTSWMAGVDAFVVRGVQSNGIAHDALDLPVEFVVAMRIATVAGW